MTDPVELERLSFAYPGAGRAAVTGVDLRVQPGEVVAVVGPSGSGKSTLLRLVAGLLPVSGGTVRLGGDDVTHRPPERRRVGMVFQGYALLPHLTVRDNIGFGLAVRKVPRSERGPRIDDVAERLGLTPLLGRRPEQVSGGERQRVALARALLRDPVVFCLDEPLSALDPVLRSAARRDLDAVLRDEGRCALHVTHDQVEAMTLGDRVAVLRDGALEQVGTPREVYERPATTFVASFVGSHPMSLLPPSLVGGGLVPGTDVVGVRAEHVALVAGDGAVVTSVDDLGHERLVVLDADGLLVRVQLGPGDDVRRGDRVGFEVRQRTCFDAEGRRVG